MKGLLLMSHKTVDIIIHEDGRIELDQDFTKTKSQNHNKDIESLIDAIKKNAEKKKQSKNIDVSISIT